MVSSLVLTVLLGLPAEEIRTALELNVGSTRWQDKCEFVVVTEWERKGLGVFRQSARIRRDGSKIDFAGELKKTDDENFPGNGTSRSIVNGEWYFSRTTTTGRKKLTGGRSAKLVEASNREIESSTYGFMLDGHFAGNDGKKLSQILLESDDLTADTEQIEGRSCLAISGTTRYGKIKICLDAESGHTLRYARISKGPGDVYSGEQYGQHRDTTGQRSFTCEVNGVTVEKVGDYFIPVSGTFITETVGTTNAQFSVPFKRSDFNLSPDFAGTDAFQMDFDEGARVSDFDNRESQIAYIWQKGDMYPEGAAGLPTVVDRGGFHTAPVARNRVVWFFAANIVLLTVAGIWFLMSRAKA
ncbi:MAG: hypothetical protein U0941_12430 [Planctomycetaceae bacterium]